MQCRILYTNSFGYDRVKTKHMITEDNYGNILPTDKDFHVQMTSDKYMEHCDLRPHESYQHVNINHQGRLKIFGKSDYLAKSFKVKLIPDFESIETKECKGGCTGVGFPLDTKFDQDGKCPRCAGRATRTHD